MKRILKKGIVALFALLLLCSVFGVQAMAAETKTVDWTRRGSVSVTLQVDGAPISGAELTLYRVADAKSDDGNLSFEFTKDYTSFGGKPEEFREPGDISRLAAYTKEKGIAGISKATDASGFVTFEHLELGLYLVMQTGSAEGFSDCSPFLVTLPYSENNLWKYDLDATPKTDVVRLVDITVKKEWSDDGKHRPESVTVTLYRGDKALETATLSAQNEWTHIWKDLPESDSYRVEENVPKGYTATYKQNGWTFTVTNTAGLIQTGQLVWPIPVLAVSGLLLFALGFLLFRRKKEDA